MRRVLTALGLSIASLAAVVLLHQTRLFRLLELKAYDLQFLARGPRPTSGILLVVVDQKTLDSLPEPLLFWHRHYARAVEAAARGGARVFGLDVFFAIPVTRWEPDHDRLMVQAVIDAASSMPVVSILIPGAYDKQRERPVPLYLYASAAGLTASAHLTVDPDDFIRRQQLREEGSGKVRSLALSIAEKYIGREDLAIPTGRDGAMVINYAGPAGTFPRVPLVDFLAADARQVRAWVEGKIVLLGFDTITNEDRHATPFYVLKPGTRANTAGIEIHASILQTILQRDFLAAPPVWAAGLILLAAALAGAATARQRRLSQALLHLLLLVLLALALTHVLFRAGIVLSATRLTLTIVVAALAVVISQTERRRAFFARAFSIFVGKGVAESLEDADQIPVAAGARSQFTILFSDIRGFTAFCEEKEPALVVQDLNRYLSAMVEIIVRHGGEVNKFIGDGILAVFSDQDHAGRAVRCGLEMIALQGQFRTGVGIHSGEVVAGNVGSFDKLEHTVLGATVNLASRLEGLNKKLATQLLLSEETKVLLDGSISLVDLGAAPVAGLGQPVRVFTPAVVAPRLQEAPGV